MTRVGRPGERRQVRLLLLAVLATGAATAAAAAGGAKSPAIITDSTKPSVAFEGEATRGRVLDGGVWDVDVTATDGTAASPGSGVARISVRLDSHAPQVEKNDCGDATNCEQAMTFTFDVSALKPGPHTITATATDRAGNRGSGTLRVRTARSPSASSCNPAKYDVYNAGNRVAGRAMTYADRTCEVNEDGSHSTDTSYTYGTCDPGDDEGCAVPLTVNSAPLCERHAALYTDAAGHRTVHRNLTIKGVPAASFESGETLEIYTGRTTITLSGSRALVARAARQLRRPPSRNIPTLARTLRRPAVADRRTSPARLPAPNRATLKRTKPC